jgi:hypothetical protein
MKKLLFFLVIVLFINLSFVNAFIVKDNQAIQITKGASTFTFELRYVNGSSALLDKTHQQDRTGESAQNNGLWYNPSDCLIKTERGCHLQLVNVYSSEDTGYLVLEDLDSNEEVTLSMVLDQFSVDSAIYTFDEPLDLFLKKKHHQDTKIKVYHSY